MTPMTPSWTWRTLLRKNFRIAALGLAMIGATLEDAWAQAPAPVPTPVGNNSQAFQEAPGRTYFNRRTMLLPVRVDERMKGQIQEVHLFVKDSPQAPWTFRDRITPGQASTFRYQAARDGEFAFSMTTIDRQNRSWPESPDQEPPGLVVVIDTTPPTVNLHAVGESDDGPLFHLDIQDENLDLTATRFLFQTGDRVFRPLEPLATKQNVYCIPKQAVFTGLIRVVAGDLAGNKTQRQINLNQATPAENVVPVAKAPVNNSQGETIVAVEQAQPMPKGPSVVAQRVPTRNVPTAPLQLEVPEVQPLPQSQAPERPRALPNMLPNLTRTFETIQPGEQSPTMVRPNIAPAVARREGSIVRKFVNSPRLAINYQIEQAGASGVGRVDVWATRDMGQTWQKIGESRDRKSPVEVTLPGEGLVGVTLVVSNGRGFGGTPPNPGDAPEMWVEVDTTRPAAEITDIRNVENEPSSVHVLWKTTDKNLSAEPVDLFYAKDRQGPWQLIAKGLRNTGQYRWSPSTEVGAQAYVKLVVKDLAGNSSTSETLQPVLLDDLSRPRARILGIQATPSGPVATPSANPISQVTLPLPPVVDER